MSNIKWYHGSITTNNECVVSSDVPGKPLFKRCAWRGSQKLCMGHGRGRREGERAPGRAGERLIELYSLTWGFSTWVILWWKKFLWTFFVSWGTDQIFSQYLEHSEKVGSRAVVLAVTNPILLFCGIYSMMFWYLGIFVALPFLLTSPFNVISTSPRINLNMRVTVYLTDAPQ